MHLTVLECRVTDVCRLIQEDLQCSDMRDSIRYVGGIRGSQQERNQIDNTYIGDLWEWQGERKDLLVNAKFHFACPNKMIFVHNTNKIPSERVLWKSVNSLSLSGVTRTIFYIQMKISIVVQLASFPLFPYVHIAGSRERTTQCLYRWHIVNCRWIQRVQMSLVTVGEEKWWKKTWRYGDSSWFWYGYAGRTRHEAKHKIHSYHEDGITKWTGYSNQTPQDSSTANGKPDIDIDKIICLTHCWMATSISMEVRFHYQGCQKSWNIHLALSEHWRSSWMSRQTSVTRHSKTVRCTHEHS